MEAMARDGISVDRWLRPGVGAPEAGVRVLAAARIFFVVTRGVL
jgi:hypothetical protein